jgi:hypothetical protein
MANRVQLSGPKEAEKYVLHMVSKSINVRKNRRSNQEWTIQRKPKEQSRMDNPETLAILGTQDTGQINIRENRRGNQEWTIQRHWQHWVHKTHDEDKQNK